MTDDFMKIKETVRALNRAGLKCPKIGIILGTGLGHFARSIRNPVRIPFSECPHFPEATSIGHAGQLVYGSVSGRSVVAMEGRFHYFEGYSLNQVTYPVRVMKALGVKTLILSNAAGGLNPHFALGDIMLVSDHINLMGDSPLAGPNDDRLGLRFPDMLNAYCPDLNALAERVGMGLKIPFRKGVYVGVKGPQLETKAEYRFLRMMGADAVGMSTIPEVIAARHANMNVMAFSCITDMCLADSLEPADIQKILKVAAKSEPILTRWVIALLKALK